VAASRPVDLGQVAARLLEIAADNNTSPQASYQPFDRERSPTPPPPTKEEVREEQRQEYNALLRIGGRPWFPFDLLEEASEDPEEYREMLAFWRIDVNGFDDIGQVFSKQLGRWLDFRDWQRYVRGIPVDDGFPEFAEMMKPLVANDIWLARTLSGRELDEEIKRLWEGGRTVRGWKLHGARVVGGFPAHIETVRCRLARHKFTRTFQLDENPKRQDKLTTWIEYLNFEYWWYDRYASSVKRQQPLYDEAWKKLVDSKVLRPHETEQYVLSDAWGFQQEAEQGRAYKDVKSAEEAAKAVLASTQTEPQRSSFTKSQRFRMLAEAQSRLDTARDSHKSIKQRGDLIGDFREGTKNYRRAKKDAERHNILLRWILEQVPLVEAELKESEEARRSSAARGTKRRCRRDQDEASKDRVPKRQRRNDEAIPSGGDTQVKEKSRRGRHKDTADDEQPPKRSRFGNRSLHPQQDRYCGVDELPTKRTMTKSNKVPNKRPLRSAGAPKSLVPQHPRRSPRIAARQDSSRVALPPPQAAKSSHQRTRRKVIQAPTPPSSTGSQDHQSRQSATTISKGRGTRGDTLSTQKPKQVLKRR
jgi:hypothetical protein